MDYLFHLATLITIYAIAAISLNYVAGFTGIISLNHATFFGLGAYGIAILTVKHGLNFIPSLLIGVAVAGLVAYAISFPLLRLKNDAFILVSVGFSVIAFNLMLNLGDLTNGPLGIKGVKAPVILGIDFASKPLFLLLVLAFAIATYLFFRHITASPYGTIIKGIRENSTVTSVNGHAVSRYQRSVYTLGAMGAALGGSFLAVHLTFIEPKLFELFSSLLFLIMVILGGLGSLKGSIFGAMIMLLVPEMLRFIGLPYTYLAETQQIIYGLILVALMFVRPQGILGDYRI